MNHIIWKYFCLIFFYVIDVYSNAAKEGVLSVVQIFRHGERTPLKFYPTDPYKNGSYWKLKPGRLTNKGKLQSYNLGQFTRTRYANLLPTVYSEEDFYAYSTDKERTHMSTQAFIAGLYPPSETEIWKSEIYWNPIPVHPIPNYLLHHQFCPTYFEGTEEAFENEYKEFISKHNDSIKEIALHTSLNSSIKSEMTGLYDTMSVEEGMGFELPTWAKPFYPEFLKSLTTLLISRDSLTDQLKRLVQMTISKYLKFHIERIVALADKQVLWSKFPIDVTPDLFYYINKRILKLDLVIFEIKQNQIGICSVYILFCVKLQAVAVGPFFDTMLDQFKKKIQNPSLGQKLTAFGAHDLDIMALLRTLGHNHYFPMFSSSLFLELWKLNETAYIKIVFKNGETLNHLKINGCVADCNITEFEHNFSNYLIDEDTFIRECFNNTESSVALNMCLKNMKQEI